MRGMGGVLSEVSRFSEAAVGRVQQLVGRVQQCNLLSQDTSHRVSVKSSQSFHESRGSHPAVGQHSSSLRLVHIRCLRGDCYL